MTTYCPTCFFKNDYTLVKPVNCGKCGKPMVFKVEGTNTQIRLPSRTAATKTIDSSVEDDSVDASTKESIKQRLLEAMGSGDGISVEGSNPDKILFQHLKPDNE